LGLRHITALASNVNLIEVPLHLKSLFGHRIPPGYRFGSGDAHRFLFS
jgi:hypothetical protein